MRTCLLLAIFPLALSCPGLAAQEPGSLTEEVPRVSLQLGQSPERVWAVLGKVYDELALPPTVQEAENGLVRSVNQRVRRIGGQSVSRFFTCAGAFGNSAATGDVFVSAQTQLIAGEGGGTEASTAVGARVRSAGGWVDCRSNGKLEALIGEKLKEQASRSAT